MSLFAKKICVPKHTDKQNCYIYQFEPRPKSFKTGKDIQPKRDLTRFVKWPNYIQIQRERKILRERLKIPPMINQFTACLDKNITKQLLVTLSEYEKNFSSDNISRNNNFIHIKHGINTVTNLIKKKKALFIVIANDVNPIELVVWLPTLCQKMDIPYCIVQNKSKLGKLVNKKKTSCVAITSLSKKGQENMKKLIDCFRLNFNDRYEESKKRWGGGITSKKKK